MAQVLKGNEPTDSAAGSTGNAGGRIAGDTLHLFFAKSSPLPPFFPTTAVSRFYKKTTSTLK